jgi:hypothetical protein
MRLSSSLCTSIAIGLLLVIGVGAQQRQEPRRTGARMLTDEDVASPNAANSTAEETISTTRLTGSPVSNARTVLEHALTKMSEINSMRTRLQAFMPDGPKEVLIEVVKPDRMHVVSPYGEMFSIGRKFYVKGAKGWQVTDMAGSGAQSDSGFDFRTYVKQMIGKSSVRITGQTLGDQMIEGVDTVVYEFAITEGSESGTIQISVGKDDGYLRRMSISGGAVKVRIWFGDINEQFSIDPPM